LQYNFDFGFGVQWSHIHVVKHTYSNLVVMCYIFLASKR